MTAGAVKRPHVLSSRVETSAIHRAARSVCEALQAAGHQAQYVGGAVRDVLLDPAAYADLLRRAQGRDPLAVLTADFDRRLAALHTPAGGAALKRVAAAGIGPRTRRARKTATR